MDTDITTTTNTKKEVRSITGKLTLSQISTILAIIGIFVGWGISLESKHSDSVKAQQDAVFKQHDQDNLIDSMKNAMAAINVQLNEIKAAFATHDAKDILNQKDFDVRMDNVEKESAIIETRFNDLLYYSKPKIK